MCISDPGGEHEPTKDSADLAGCPMFSRFVVHKRTQNEACGWFQKNFRLDSHYLIEDLPPTPLVT